MVILLPLYSVSDPAIVTKYPRVKKLAVGAAIYVAYLTLPWTSQFLFIQFPSLFGALVEPIVISMMVLFSAVLIGTGYFVHMLYAFLESRIVRGWMWTLWAVSLVFMLLWIPVLISSTNEIVVEHCASIMELVGERPLGCWR